MVVGPRYHGKNENNEIPQMWQAFHPRIGEIKNMVTDRLAYGISASMDLETGEFDYIAGFEVSGGKEVPEGMVAFEVPGGRYAVFTTTLLKIGETFQSPAAAPSSSCTTNSSIHRTRTPRSISTSRSSSSQVQRASL
jgi:predicted transcriptional regulator YdeE